MFRRIQYAKLWRSLILADVDGIKSASIAMNAGDSYQLFAGMLTNRPWEQVWRLPIIQTSLKSDHHVAFIGTSRWSAGTRKPHANSWSLSWGRRTTEAKQLLLWTHTTHSSTVDGAALASQI